MRRTIINQKQKPGKILTFLIFLPRASARVCKTLETSNALSEMLLRTDEVCCADNAVNVHERVLAAKEIKK